MIKIAIKAMPLITNVLWPTGFITIVSISLFLTHTIFDLLKDIKFLNIYVVLGISTYLFINIYVLVCGLLFRLIVPKMKEGRYNTKSLHFFYWRFNWHFYSYIFLFLRQYLYYTPFIRYLVLKLFRVNLKYSTYIAETADFQDCNNLITIGEGSGVGSEVLLSTHLALSPDISIQKKLTIGDNSHIQARVCLAPGVTIGNNSIIGFASMLSLSTKVGNNTRIGACTLVDANCNIGNNCHIGHNVVISEGIYIEDNTHIPDFSQITRIKDSNGKVITLINSSNINKFIHNTQPKLMEIITEEKISNTNV